jgi:plastocyanin
VTAQNFAFAPAGPKTSTGATATWTDKDTDTVTSPGSGGPLHAAPLATGATYRYAFTEFSTYACFCTIPPFMASTVEVTP